MGNDPQRPARILAVGNMYPPHHVGGYETAWRSVMELARQHGHALRILTSDYRRREVAEPDDPDVFRCLQWYWDLEAYAFPQLGARDRLSIERANARQLDHHIADFRPDLVTWWSMGCMSLSLIERVRRRGLPAVSVVHDDWPVYGFQHDQWIRMWRGSRRILAPASERIFGIPTAVALDRSGRFVFNSRYTRGHAAAAGLDVADARVVHPGIDEGFLAGPPAQPWGWRLVCVGRVDRQKGVDTAVRALAHLPEATLSIVGDGDPDYLAEIRGLARTAGTLDRLRVEGFAGPERLRAVYEQADAVLFPVRWEEPFGLVPLEAMGMNRPVVATARGGTREFIVDDGNALVVPADDAEALARAVRRLANDPELRERLTTKGQATAREHTAHDSARRTLESLLETPTG